MFEDRYELASCYDDNMYQTEHPNDGYNALRLYLEKLNPECSAFFQDHKQCGLGIDALE